MAWIRITHLATTAATALTLLAAVPMAYAASPAKAAAMPVANGPLQGTVVRVLDGDSLLLRTADDRPPLEIRLQGIDAPEGCQDGGPEARQMLADFVGDKAVTATVRGRDHYGRTLATIEVDGLNVNQRMVAEGHAWSLRTKWDRGPYVAQERMAQALKRGLHAAGGAIAPVEFRRRHGPCKAAPANASGDAPSGAPAGAPAATQASPGTAAAR